MPRVNGLELLRNGSKTLAVFAAPMSHSFEAHYVIGLTLWRSRRDSDNAI